MNVPLLDVGAQNRSLKQEIMAAVEAVYDSNQFIMGPYVSRFEKEVAEYLSVPHAVGVSSGTDALLLALMALGIGQGDAVITSTFSFFATAGVISRLGAKPYFADIEEDTFNIDGVSAENAVIRAIEDGYKVKAIIPVHLYGQCADMEAMVSLAGKYSLSIVEDAAQAIGARCLFRGNGYSAGCIGDFGCFSFFPSKNLGCLGDGGLVVTGDDTLADRLRLLRTHGARPKYYHAEIGGNFRLDALQAAVLSVKLKYLDKWHAGRRKNADMYRKLFKGTGLLESGNVVLPEEKYSKLENGHIYNQFVIRARERDKLRGFLGERNIGSEIYYPVPFHLQECFKDLGYKKGDFPGAEAAAGEVLALPIYAELIPEQQEYVVNGINDFYRSLV